MGVVNPSLMKYHSHVELYPLHGSSDGRLPLKIIAGCVFVEQLLLSSSTVSPVILAGRQACGDLGKAMLN